MDHTSIITQVSNPKEEEIISFNQEKVSQSNSSVKKQRSPGIFSTFFCCFRNYNVEPPASNNTTTSLPPAPEENGTQPKFDQVEVIPIPSPPAKFLLPEMNISDYGKKCVVIDLDETLVHSSFKPISNADFIVPVEIDGTVHQETLSRILSSGLRVLLYPPGDPLRDPVFWALRYPPGDPLQDPVFWALRYPPGDPLQDHVFWALRYPPGDPLRDPVFWALRYPPGDPLRDPVFWALRYPPGDPLRDPVFWALRYPPGDPLRDRVWLFPVRIKH
ncbi:CTD small phosphatase-like protein isoform X2 [Oncorhynchus nerka]|uniref:CTD small phosphatase-like protein isoform X2 n=1 Tax=Oncorhynchus nerka TaxID=8023 RepID=UPI0011329319|nr:CTD small phosphatase-like protein isoform X2 [Oncorhynchus nerka]